MADIFRSNAQKNGIVPAVIDAEAHAWLLAHPGAEICVDLEACEVQLPGDRRAAFAMDPFARHCLMEGIDQLGYLLGKSSDIEHYEAGR